MTIISCEGSPMRIMPEDTVAIHLENVYAKVGFPSYFNPKNPLNLYCQLKNGDKSSEWRECKHYWLSRLCKKPKEVFEEIENFDKKYRQRVLHPLNLTSRLKVHTAWFFEGYSKDKLLSQLHLEVEIIGLLYHPEEKALEIKIANTVEVRCLYNNQSNISKTTLDKK
jgi:hypothetical protein